MSGKTYVYRNPPFVWRVSEAPERHEVDVEVSVVPPLSFTPRARLAWSLLRGHRLTADVTILDARGWNR